MRRLIVAAVGAAAILALYGVLVWAFFVHVWPKLPPWLAMVGFILLAVFIIGSPIAWLLRLSRNTPVPEHLLRRRPPGDGDER